MFLSFFMALGASVRSRVTRGLTYGPGKTGKLDVYAPVGADGEAPVVVFVHSGWPSFSERRHFAVIGQILASRGFVTVIPDFHVYPEARHPDFVEDIALATAWTRAHAADHGGDPDRLFVAGHSGGAFPAVSLALDPRWLKAEGLEPRHLRGVVGICGLYDASPASDPRMTAVFGPRDAWPGIMPVNLAHPDAPPMLLVAGGRDRVDPDRNTGALAQALRAAGGRVAEIRYPTLGDFRGIHSLVGSLEFRATVLEEVERFIRLHSLVPVA